MPNPKIREIRIRDRKIKRGGLGNPNRNGLTASRRPRKNI